MHHDFEKIKRGRPKKKRKKRLTSLKKDFTPTSLREKVSGLIVAGCDAAKGKDTVAILCIYKENGPVYLESPRKPTCAHIRIEKGKREVRTRSYN